MSNFNFPLNTSNANPTPSFSIILLMACALQLLAADNISWLGVPSTLMLDSISLQQLPGTIALPFANHGFQILKDFLLKYGIRGQKGKSIKNRYVKILCYNYYRHIVACVKYNENKNYGEYYAYELNC